MLRLMIVLAAVTVLTPTAPFSAHAQAVPNLSLVETVRIGSADDPDRGFTVVGDIVVESKSNIYVAERRELQIRVFDRGGRPIRRVGQRGEGPAEFRQIGRIGIRGDTLWASDDRLGRILLFSLAGQPLGTVAAPAIALTSPVRSAWVLAGSLVLGADGRPRMDRPMGGAALNNSPAPPDSVTVPIIALRRNRPGLDTIRHLQLYLVPDNDKGGPRRPAQTDLALNSGPPSDKPIRLLLGNDLIVVDRSRKASAPYTFSVTRLNQRGTVVYKKSLSYAPTPYRAAFADSVFKESGTRVPRTQAPVADAKVGPDGTLWLRRDADGLRASTWTVIAPDGRVRGNVSLPVSDDVRWISKDSIVVVRLDEYEVPWVVQYRITGG